MRGEWSGRRTLFHMHLGWLRSCAYVLQLNWKTKQMDEISFLREANKTHLCSRSSSLPKCVRFCGVFVLWQGRSCSQPSGSADPDDHQQIPFKPLLFIPNDPIENQDYYTSTPVPKISSFAPAGGVGTATVVAASSRRGTQLFFPFFFDSPGHLKTN